MFVKYRLLLRSLRCPGSRGCRDIVLMSCLRRLLNLLMLDELHLINLLPSCRLLLLLRCLLLMVLLLRLLGLLLLLQERLRLRWLWLLLCNALMKLAARWFNQRLEPVVRWYGQCCR